MEIYSFLACIRKKQCCSTNDNLVTVRQFRYELSVPPPPQGVFNSYFQSCQNVTHVVLKVWWTWKILPLSPWWEDAGIRLFFLMNTQSSQLCSISITLESQNKSKDYKLLQNLTKFAKIQILIFYPYFALCQSISHIIFIFCNTTVLQRLHITWKFDMQYCKIQIWEIWVRAMVMAHQVHFKFEAQS